MSTEPRHNPVIPGDCAPALPVCLASSPRDSAGCESAKDRPVVERVYGELRALAQRALQHERAGYTLQATELVHEVYLRLAPRGWADSREPKDFLHLASKVIRQVLVDLARAKRTEKRGGDRVRVELGDAAAAERTPMLDVLALDEALQQLEALDAQQARIVELRFFGGLTEDEAAVAMGVSPRTVRYQWAYARGWLRRKLAGQMDDPSVSGGAPAGAGQMDGEVHA